VFAAAACAAVCLAGVVRADAKKVSDQEFIKEAAQGGTAEVKLGELAQENASSPAVKKFGRRMVEDHSMANKQLTGLLNKKGTPLAGKELNREQKENYDRLSKLHGAAFDRAYIKDMVKDHKEDVALFRSAAKNLKDPDLRAWAEKTLPTLEEHLRMAEGLAGGGGRDR
jgi:putative membrane protein